MFHACDTKVNNGPDRLVYGFSQTGVLWFSLLCARLWVQVIRNPTQIKQKQAFIGRILGITQSQGKNAAILQLCREGLK